MRGGIRRAIGLAQRRERQFVAGRLALGLHRRIVHHAAGLNQCRMRAVSSSQFVHKSPRTRCASSCASTWRRRRWKMPSRHCFRHDDSRIPGSGNAGADRIRRHEQLRDAFAADPQTGGGSSSFRTAASVTGRQAARRRCRTTAASRQLQPEQETTGEPDRRQDPPGMR